MSVKLTKKIKLYFSESYSGQIYYTALHFHDLKIKNLLSLEKKKSNCIGMKVAKFHLQFLTLFHSKKVFHSEIAFEKDPIEKECCHIQTGSPFSCSVKGSMYPFYEYNANPFFLRGDELVSDSSVSTSRFFLMSNETYICRCSAL